MYLIQVAGARMIGCSYTDAWNSPMFEINAPKVCQQFDHLQMIMKEGARVEKILLLQLCAIQ